LSLALPAPFSLVFVRVSVTRRCASQSGLDHDNLRLKRDGHAENPESIALSSGTHSERFGWPMHPFRLFQRSLASLTPKTSWITQCALCRFSDRTALQQDGGVAERRIVTARQLPWDLSPQQRDREARGGPAWAFWNTKVPRVGAKSPE